MHEAAETREADWRWWMSGCFCAVGCGGAVEGVVALLCEAQFCGEGADVVFVVGEALRWEDVSVYGEWAEREARPQHTSTCDLLAHVLELILELSHFRRVVQIATSHAQRRIMRIGFALLSLIIPVLGSHGCVVVVVVVVVLGPAVVEYIHGSHKQGGTRASAPLCLEG